MDSDYMYKNYVQYIKYLKKANRKRAWRFFIVCLIILLICVFTLAIFSPEDRQFAIGMGIFGLLTFTFIHISGFYYYIKNRTNGDEGQKDD